MLDLKYNHKILSITLDEYVVTTRVNLLQGLMGHTKC